MARLIVTLDYYVPRGLLRGSVLADRVEAVTLDRGERELLGLDLTSDTTSTEGNYVIRTLVLQQTEQGSLDIPGESNLIAATRGLYAGALACALPACVEAATPVVS